MAETFGQGNTAWWTNTERQLEAKILNKLSAGGTGGAGIVAAGSPQGVVTAPPGTTYLDSSTGSLWMKETGVGNTGWLQLIA
jgi:hypothetical protein